MRKTIDFTKNGYEQVQKEHDDLVAKRKDAVKELSTASEMGDRSENAAYKVARQKLSRIDSRIRYLNNLLRFGRVVEREFKGYVDIGCKVVVDDGNRKKEFTIVGGHESDISKGSISIFSPIGKSLMGKRSGDKVTIHVPAGIMVYTLIEVIPM